jgi:hypothetical protein
MADEPGFVSIRSVLKGRAQKASPEDQRWRAERHADVRGYFEGTLTLPELRASIGGYTSLRLLSMTDPATEEFSLLMSALDVLLDDRGVRKTPLGLLTAGEYADMLRPAVSAPRASRHGW